MNTKVDELMSESVVTAEPHQSVEHVRKMLDKNGIGSVPVINSGGEPVGVVSATDLARDLKPGSSISAIMMARFRPPEPHRQGAVSRGE